MRASRHGRTQTAPPLQDGFPRIPTGDPAGIAAQTGICRQPPARESGNRAPHAGPAQPSPTPPDSGSPPEKTTPKTHWVPHGRQLQGRRFREQER